MWEALNWVHLAQEGSSSGFCENDDKPSGYIKCVDFPDQLRDCQHLKEDSYMTLFLMQSRDATLPIILPLIATVWTAPL